MFGKSKDLKNMEFTGLYICIGEGKPSLCLTVVILTCWLSGSSSILCNPDEKGYCKALIFTQYRKVEHW